MIVKGLTLAVQLNILQDEHEGLFYSVAYLTNGLYKISRAAGDRSSNAKGHNYYARHTG